MKNLLYYFCWLIPFFWLTCSSPEVSTITGNPPAKGFNVANSDKKAIVIADKAMEAMGGRANWDKTRYLKWNFFGSRKHLWDKYTGDIRIDYLKEPKTVLMNIHSMEGKAMVNDTLIEKGHPDHADIMKQGKAHWINDAYWLVMPFKLKDSGVTLQYLGVDTTLEGRQAAVLALTFENVGVTPDNKYHVYADPASGLITQWDFYSNATDSLPRFQTPWANYQTYGNIKLSGDRGKYQLTEIEVPDNLESSLFVEF